MRIGTLFSILFTIVSSEPVYLLTIESDPSLNPTGYIEGLPSYVEPFDHTTGQKTA